jgi:phosphomevalonate kinase
LRARAPGKLVLSGGYAVLEGAPALVAAVDRYAIADSAEAAPMVTEEVGAALTAGELERAPWFDASELREGDHKLGLGSSASILVASLAAVWLERGGLESLLAAELFPRALAIHRAAQQGGSGIDVAAACFGGVLACRLATRGGALEVVPHALPPGVTIEVYACGRAARTADMLTAVAALAEREPARYRAAIDAAGQGASKAVDARDASRFVEAIADQATALAGLGEAAGVPIVTADVALLDGLARAEDACMLPSGAGGGDVAARGVHAVPA